MNGGREKGVALVYLGEKKRAIILKSIAGGRGGKTHPIDKNRLNVLGERR